MWVDSFVGVVHAEDGSGRVRILYTRKNNLAQHDDDDGGGGGNEKITEYYVESRLSSLYLYTTVRRTKYIHIVHRQDLLGLMHGPRLRCD